MPIFPGAQFIASYDAGRGQRYYIFGSPATFVDLVAYYRTVLKQKGELVYDVPATHEFDVGKFSEETMAFPPGVTIKDFQSDISQGYPNPKPGGQPARFPTIIQIVPVVSSIARGAQKLRDQNRFGSQRQIWPPCVHALALPDGGRSGHHA